MTTVCKTALICCLVLGSCATQDRSKEKGPDQTAGTENAAEKGFATIEGPGRTDTLVIDKRAAVSFEPDSLRVEKGMREAGEGDFRAGMDDYLYYMSESGEYLEQQGLPLLDSKDRKYLKFVSEGRIVQLVRLDTLPDLCGIYLFDPGKKPLYADIMDMENAYKSYYK